MTVKRVDPWSILKLGLVLNIAGAAILLITGMVVWSVIRRLQLIERACDQAQGLLGFESCTVNGVEIMRTGLLLAGLLVVVVTGVMVFAAFLYNLVADLTGGIEVSMLDHSGQLRTAQGGVQVSPELTGRVGQPETGRSAGGGRPEQDWAGTGAGLGASSGAAAGAGTGGLGVAAADAGGPGRTGPVMSSADPTIASASARPNTAVPLGDDDVVPPVIRAQPAAPIPTGAMPSIPAPGHTGNSARESSSGGPDGREGSRSPDREPRRGAPEHDMWPAGERPSSTDGPDDQQVPRRRAAAAGARFRDAADRTGAALSDVAQRAGTALHDITAAEASARAERSNSDRQSLDDLAAGAGSSAPARTGQERRGPAGGARGGAAGGGAASRPDVGRSRRVAAGDADGGSPRSRAGSSDAASPQQAAAARVRSQPSSTAPARGPDGKFLPKAEAEDRPARGRDDSAKDLFSQHPGRGDDADD